MRLMTPSRKGAPAWIRPAQRTRPLPGPHPFGVAAGGRAQLQLGVQAGGPGGGHQSKQPVPQCVRLAVALVIARPVGFGWLGWLGRARSAGRRAGLARAARPCSWLASDSPGCPNGTPSRAETCAGSVAPCWARSARLISSQFSATSAAPVTATSANTCGWRRTSLATIRVGHVVDGVPGAVIPLGGDLGVEQHLQQHVPARPERAVVPFSSASRASYGSSSRCGAREMGLLGVPRAPVRSTVMVVTRSSSRAPGTSAEPRSTSLGRPRRRARPAARRHPGWPRRGAPGGAVSQTTSWSRRRPRRRPAPGQLVVRGVQDVHVDPAATSAARRGWSRRGQHRAAARSESQACRVSSPGATRGLVTSRISTTARSRRWTPSEVCRSRATACPATRPPRTGCSSSGPYCGLTLTESSLYLLALAVLNCLVMALTVAVAVGSVPPLCASA